jgi:lipoate-protein ligase A
VDADALASALEAATAEVEATARTIVLASTRSGPAVVLGSAQPEASISRERCRRDGLAVERRRSGGGAVLCDPDFLEVDLLVPVAAVPGGTDVTESYRPWGEAWLAGLEALGVRGRLATIEEAREQDARRRAVARAACWAGLSPYEVVAGAPAGKLVGFSQRRRRGILLLQAGIACRGGQDRLLPYLVLDDEDRLDAVAALGATASLDRLGVEFAPEGLWRAMEPALTRPFGA